MNSSRGTANLVMRCKFCKRDLTARMSIKNSHWLFIKQSSLLEFEPTFKIRKYDVEQNGKFQQIAQFDCRGLELVDFQPRVSFWHLTDMKDMCPLTSTI